MIRWNEWIHWVFAVGVLFQTAYLSGPTRHLMHVWVFMAIVLLPFVCLLFFQEGVFSDEVVERAHLVAALWYMAITLTCVVLALAGVRPRGWIVYFAFMAPGAVISLRLIARRLADPPPPVMPAR